MTEATTVESWGGLRCHVVSPGGPPELLVVLAHGYAAPGDDLVGLCAGLRASSELGERVAFVCPEAPHVASANPWYGRAWWQLDVELVERAVVDRDRTGLLSALEAGVPEARAVLVSVVEDAGRHFGLPLGCMVVGGFSQGAMAMTAVALEGPVPPAGLALFSSTLLSERAARQGVHRLRGAPCLVAHGVRDPLLPVEGARELAALLEEGGADVELLEFAGTHRLPPLAGDALARLLTRALLRSPVHRASA